MYFSSSRHLHPPLTAAADLDRPQVAAAHQGVDLGARGVQDLGDVGQEQEPRAGETCRSLCQLGCASRSRRPVACGRPRLGPRIGGRLGPGGRRTGDPHDHATHPPPTRHRRPGWRDPRILVGLVIVAASVLVGVKVLAAADDSVGVWAVRKDLPAGTRVDAARGASGCRSGSPAPATPTATCPPTTPLPRDCRAPARRRSRRAAAARSAIGRGPTRRWSRCRCRSTSTRCRPRCGRAR